MVIKQLLACISSADTFEEETKENFYSVGLKESAENNSEITQIVQKIRLI